MPVWCNYFFTPTTSQENYHYVHHIDYKETTDVLRHIIAQKHKRSAKIFNLAMLVNATSFIVGVEAFIHIMKKLYISTHITHATIGTLRTISAQ